jgi:lysophospholipase L1-like esterase
MGRTLGWKKGLLLSSLSCTVFILLLECGSRLVLRSRGERILTIPGEYYWENKPGMRKAERGILYATNSAGFRGPERPLVKRPAVSRVVCLGDSSTFGFLNREDECYPALLGECLRERGGEGRYEVINAGVSGYTTLQQAIALMLRVLPLEPDVVVIQCGHNNRSMSISTDRSGLYRGATRWGKLTGRSRFLYLAGKLLPRLGLVRRPRRFDPGESLANVRGDLSVMIDRCRAGGARVILLSWGQHPDAERLTAEGIARYQEGRYAEAREKLEAAAAIEYNWDWRPVHYLALCGEHLGDRAMAERARRVERELKEEHPWVLEERPYLDAFREVAAAQGVPLLEYRDVALKASYFLDICHPSPEFTRRMAKDLCDLILESADSGRRATGRAAPAPS